MGMYLNYKSWIFELKLKMFYMRNFPNTKERAKSLNLVFCVSAIRIPTENNGLK